MVPLDEGGEVVERFEGTLLSVNVPTKSCFVEVPMSVSSHSRPKRVRTDPVLRSQPDALEGFFSCDGEYTLRE